MTPFLVCRRGGDRFSPFAILSVLAIVLIWIAAPLRAQSVYVTNYYGNVSAYSIGAQGVLTPVPGSPFRAGSIPVSVAVDPTGKFAYVANLHSDNISAYHIDANGGLKPVTGSPFAAGTAPKSVAVDPIGKFVYVANKVSGNISAYRIDANGGLKPVTGSPFTTAGRAPLGLTVDTTGRFVYAVGGHDVLAYSIDADGSLKAVPGSPFPAGTAPSGIVVDPTGKFVDVAIFHPNVTGDVSAYRIGANGALTPVPGSPFNSAVGGPDSLAIDPTGRFIYIANYQSFSVSAARIDANGALKPFPGQPFSVDTSAGNQSMAVDPTGKFLYAADQVNGVVSANRIGKDGALTAVTGSPFTAGDQPYAVAVSPFVPFASSSAELVIHKDIVSLSESFTLGVNSNGIDPVTEKVTLQIGTFSVTIPAGSFKLHPGDQTYSFQGVINGVSIQVTMSKSGERLFILDAVFTGLDLSGITNPETVVLTFGIDSGSTAATVIFD